MKTAACHCDTPVDGSSQRGRYLKALDPAYAPVDGRSLEDLLVFAKRYAAQIRFYDVPESTIEAPALPQTQTQGPKGAAPQASAAHPSWREFFRRDLAVIAASIAVVDTAQIKKDYDELRAALDLRPSRGAFAALFDPVLGMARRIDRWYAIAIAENPLRTDLELAIASTLRAQIATTRAYEAGYKYEDPAQPLDLDYSGLDRRLWGLDQTVAPDKTIFQGATAQDRIRMAALFVDDIFHVVVEL